MLIPKKVKFRKWQTDRSSEAKLASRRDVRGSTISFGSFALKATSPARVESKQIEAARKVLSRTITKAGRLWIRVFPDRPFTAKAAEVGMGKGKGDPKGYCFQVLPGRILFEVDGIGEAVAKEALRKAGAKLPMKTKIISR